MYIYNPLCLRNIRVQGGIVGNRKEIYNPTPDLEYDGEMIPFLYKPGRGGGFNTEGDYYYVLGLPQGIFKKVRRKMDFIHGNDDKRGGY